jgi:hypothetical protein
MALFVTTVLQHLGLLLRRAQPRPFWEQHNVDGPSSTLIHTRQAGAWGMRRGRCIGMNMTYVPHTYLFASSRTLLQPDYESLLELLRTTTLVRREVNLLLPAIAPVDFHERTSHQHHQQSPSRKGRLRRREHCPQHVRLPPTFLRLAPTAAPAPFCAVTAASSAAFSLTSNPADFTFSAFSSSSSLRISL